MFDHLATVVAYQRCDPLQPTVPTGWTNVWALYRTHRDVFARATARLRRHGWDIPQDVEDELVHEFLLRKAASVLGAFDPALGSFEGLLYVAFQRFVFSELRTEQAQQRLLHTLAMASPASTTPSSSRALDSARFQELVQHLAPSYREPLLALAEAGGSVRQVATAMGLSRWTARKRIFAALRALSKALGIRGAKPEAVLRALSRKSFSS